MHEACHDWILHLESSQSKRDSYRDNALKSGRHSTRGFVHNEVGQISARSQIIPTTFHVRSGSCIALWSLRFESLEKFGDPSQEMLSATPRTSLRHLSYTPNIQRAVKSR